MRPIVNGLEAEYGDQVQFLYLNARAEGEAAFRELGLPGHPSSVVLLPDGTETYRAFGIVDANELDAAITAAIEKSG
jgi:hypothetical protein